MTKYTMVKNEHQSDFAPWQASCASCTYVTKWHTTRVYASLAVLQHRRRKHGE